MKKKLFILLMITVIFFRLYAIDLMGVWSCGSLSLAEGRDIATYSWGEGYYCDYDGITIDEENGRMFIDIKGYGSYFITELSETDGIIKLSFNFSKANKIETYYMKMLSDYELIVVDADKSNTTTFFNPNDGRRFFRLDGPSDVSVLKTPYMARVTSDTDIVWFNEVIRVSKGTLVRIVRFDRTEPIKADNYNKKFHVLFEDTGGYIEGKYLDVLSDQLIY